MERGRKGGGGGGMREKEGGEMKSKTLLTDDECSQLVSCHNLILHLPISPCVCILGSYTQRPDHLRVLLHGEEVG